MIEWLLAVAEKHNFFYSTFFVKTSNVHRVSIILFLTPPLVVSHFHVDSNSSCEGVKKLEEVESN